MGAYYGMNQLCITLGANDKAASAALFKEVGHWPQSFESTVKPRHCCAPLQTHQASSAPQVPQIAFQRSGDAFFACFALHVLNIGFENTETKRQVSQNAAGCALCFTSTRPTCSRLQPTAASVMKARVPVLSVLALHCADTPFWPVTCPLSLQLALLAAVIKGIAGETSATQQQSCSYALITCLCPLMECLSLFDLTYSCSAVPASHQPPHLVSGVPAHSSAAVL